jgi:hypothetical protein
MSNPHYVQVSYDDFYHERWNFPRPVLAARAAAAWRRKPQEAVVLMSRADFLRWKRGEFYPDRKR